MAGVTGGRDTSLFGLPVPTAARPENTEDREQKILRAGERSAAGPCDKLSWWSWVISYLEERAAAAAEATAVLSSTVAKFTFP